MTPAVTSHVAAGRMCLAMAHGMADHGSMQTTDRARRRTCCECGRPPLPRDVEGRALCGRHAAIHLGALPRDESETDRLATKQPEPT